MIESAGSARRTELSIDSESAAAIRAVIWIGLYLRTHCRVQLTRIYLKLICNVIFPLIAGPPKNLLAICELLTDCSAAVSCYAAALPRHMAASTLADPHLPSGFVGTCSTLRKRLATSRQ